MAMQWKRPSNRPMPRAKKLHQLTYRVANEAKKAYRLQVGIPKDVADQAGFVPGQYGIVGYDDETGSIRIEQVGADGYTFRHSSGHRQHGERRGRLYISVPAFDELPVSLKGAIEPDEITVETDAIAFVIAVSSNVEKKPA